MITLTKEFFTEVFKEACTKKPIKVTRVLYASLPESMQRKEDWTDNFYNLSNDTLKEMGIFGENNTKKIQDALQKKFGSASTKFIVNKDQDAVEQMGGTGFDKNSHEGLYNAQDHKINPNLK